MKKLKKILLLSSIAIILIALSIFAFIKTLSSKVERIDIDRTSITEVSKGTVPENSDEVITMALLGADYSNNNGAADVTMLLSINKKTNEINLCSLMRDMYLDLPDGGMSNLNYTLNDGGAELLLKTINYNFDLAIDKFAQVNLHTLPIIID
ncbi:LCP family protein, partial [Clostridium sp.]|uniref:LCP family protein n=1 Tax=Clostridium sp. TaxID=1506 RepID=UPI003BB5038C